MKKLKKKKLKKISRKKLRDIIKKLTTNVKLDEIEDKVVEAIKNET